MHLLPLRAAARHGHQSGEAPSKLNSKLDALRRDLIAPGINVQRSEGGLLFQNVDQWAHGDVAVRIVDVAPKQGARVRYVQNWEARTGKWEVIASGKNLDEFLRCKHLAQSMIPPLPLDDLMRRWGHVLVNAARAPLSFALKEPVFESAEALAAFWYDVKNLSAEVRDSSFHWQVAESIFGGADAGGDVLAAVDMLQLRWGEAITPRARLSFALDAVAQNLRDTSGAYYAAYLNGDCYMRGGDSLPDHKDVAALIRNLHRVMCDSGEFVSPSGDEGEKGGITFIGLSADYSGALPQEIDQALELIEVALQREGNLMSQLKEANTYAAGRMSAYLERQLQDVRRLRALTASGLKIAEEAESLPTRLPRNYLVLRCADAEQAMKNGACSDGERYSYLETAINTVDYERDDEGVGQYCALDLASRKVWLGKRALARLPSDDMQATLNYVKAMADSEALIRSVGGKHPLAENNFNVSGGV